ncbi:helix-turn-helix domain-containing protein [Streptomyces sp. NPDC001118]
MNWEINLHPAVESWLLKLAEEDPVSANLVEVAIDTLAESGPVLGRPLVDRLSGCRTHNRRQVGSLAGVVPRGDPGCRSPLRRVPGVPGGRRRGRKGREDSMSRYSSWAEVKRRLRENQPEVSDAEWESRKQVARTATEAYVVGHHLREIREEQGLTQAEVAKVVGISQARVSQIERGEIHNLETMRMYAQALGARITVTIEYGDRAAGAA